MKKREMINLGLDTPELINMSRIVVSKFEEQGLKRSLIRERFVKVIDSPESFYEDEVFSDLAIALKPKDSKKLKINNLTNTTRYKSWGEDGIGEETHFQMQSACSLPISVKGALMPDAHLGYGLPVGGVLATRNAVIPYAVGVDIGCRVKISILDIPYVKLEKNHSKFSKAIEQNTAFGIGARWKEPKSHEILDRDWDIVSELKNLKDLAWGQLGSSGSGNHFVEFGCFNLLKPFKGVDIGKYVALVSHSGSRGAGSKIANHFTKVAKLKCSELTGKLKNLAWLSLDSSEGQAYWQAMELMGDYASANHDVIHRDVIKAVGSKSILSVENHHNFAWKEKVDGEELIVHRKGATPAQKGQLGYIPGTLADPGFLVSGLGNKQAINSCSHGAGRAMSRRRAKNTTTRSALKKLLQEKGITLLSCGLDESPHAYKSIHEVMDSQRDLVEVVGSFYPKVVKMAPEGERPED